jgi:hypothetical protein
MRRFENMAVLASILQLPEHPFMTAMTVPSKLQDSAFCEELLGVVHEMERRLDARERVEGRANDVSAAGNGLAADGTTRRPRARETQPPPRVEPRGSMKPERTKRKWTTYSMVMARPDEKVTQKRLAEILKMDRKTLRGKIARLRYKKPSSPLCKKVPITHRKAGLRVMLHEAATDLHEIGELP